MADTATTGSSIILSWIRAIAVGALTWSGSSAMQAHPWWLPVAAGIVCGAIAVGNVELAVLFCLAALCIPLLAVNPIVGVIAAVVLFTAEHFLGGRKATGFLLLGFAFVGVFFGPMWAVAALAGYLLGPIEGAIAAVAACLAVEAAGVLTGQPAMGALLTGGSPPAVVAFAHAPDSLLSTAWVADSFRSISVVGVNRLFGAFARLSAPIALVAQPIVWGISAAVTGSIAQRPGPRRPIVMPIVAVTAGVAGAWCCDAIMRVGLSSQLAASDSAVAIALSLVTALCFVIAAETVFAKPQTAPTAPAPAPADRSGDASVDELLELIAAAQDTLATKHTSRLAVLVTEVRPVTHPDDSSRAAGGLLRRRDLLVPVYSANGGRARPSSDSSIVAAFETREQALAAAIAGQNAVVSYEASQPDGLTARARVGITFGEIVLDSGGRPLLGSALDLAARVMGLASGSQVLATADVGACAGALGVATRTLGAFGLKNVDAPVEVVEILWAAGAGAGSSLSDAAPAS